MNLKALVEIRKQKGVTQVQVGEALGKDESTYGRIESGRIDLKAKDIPMIAKAIDIPVREVVKALFFENDTA
jgi:transcriptional regulator with XRE-family HTH domain